MPCLNYGIGIVQRSENESAVSAAACQNGGKMFSEYGQLQENGKFFLVVYLPPFGQQAACAALYKERIAGEYRTLDYGLF